MFRPRPLQPRPDLSPASVPFPSLVDLCAQRLPRPGRGVSAFGSLSCLCGYRALAQPLSPRRRADHPASSFGRGSQFAGYSSSPSVTNPFRIRTYKKGGAGVLLLTRNLAKDSYSERPSKVKMRSPDSVEGCLFRLHSSPCILPLGKAEGSTPLCGFWVETSLNLQRLQRSPADESRKFGIQRIRIDGQNAATGAACR